MKIGASSERQNLGVVPDLREVLDLDILYVLQLRDLQSMKTGSQLEEGKEHPSAVDSQRVPPGVCWT